MSRSVNTWLWILAEAIFCQRLSTFVNAPFPIDMFSHQYIKLCPQYQPQNRCLLYFLNLPRHKKDHPVWTVLILCHSYLIVRFQSLHSCGMNDVRLGKRIQAGCLRSGYCQLQRLCFGGNGHKSSS